MHAVSVRAQILARRTCDRLNDHGNYETWTETVDRAIQNRAWLWARATRCRNPEDVFGHPAHDAVYDTDRTVDRDARQELGELRQLMLDRAVLLAGRTPWLGGTPTARKRESSQFNCAFLEIEIVFDAVDAFWYLLQGTGVGFKPVAASQHGSSAHVPQLKIVPSAVETTEAEGPR